MFVNKLFGLKFVLNMADEGSSGKVFTAGHAQYNRNIRFLLHVVPRHQVKSDSTHNSTRYVCMSTIFKCMHQMKCGHSRFICFFKTYARITHSKRALNAFW